MSPPYREIQRNSRNESLIDRWIAALNEIPRECPQADGRIRSKSDGKKETYKKQTNKQPYVSEAGILQYQIWPCELLT